MKLVRYGKIGHERPALVDGNGRLRDIGSIVPDIDNVSLASPAWAKLRSIEDLNALPEVASLDGVRLGPCVTGVGKVICMGLNERAHSSEIKAGAAANPIIFLKATSSISGAQDPVVYPKIGQKLDWEAELAIVIGKRCKYVKHDAAREVIAGYCILNDMSDRHWQTDQNGRMTLVTTAKCFDTFAPLGPLLVTPDEIDNPDSLQIKLWVNSELRQDFNSCDYVYGVNRAIEFCSQFFTLFPGDIISMGSGPGNAFTWKKYLEVGDRVKATIEGLGVQEFSVAAEA
jgi:2-keto-4-pentenoate hydratase/2-oxohepta-3-ene-1,7-dioic acid hydratase in catechol pathway